MVCIGHFIGWLWFAQVDLEATLGPFLLPSTILANGVDMGAVSGSRQSHPRHRKLRT